MNYKRHYDLLIERARNRVLDCYVESHHIIPRCMGGGDEKENIVALTPEEHYVAHQLLVKMHPGKTKLVYAAIMMCGKFNESRVNNKSYGWLKRRHSKNVSSQMMGNSINAGRKWSEEVVKKRAASNSKAQKGKNLSNEHREALSNAWQDKDKKAARSNAIKAACSSEESRARRRAAWADPEKSAKRLQSLRESAKDPLMQARKSVTLATTWAIKKGRPFSLIPQAS